MRRLLNILAPASLLLSIGCLLIHRQLRQIQRQWLTLICVLCLVKPLSPKHGHHIIGLDSHADYPSLGLVFGYWLQSIVSLVETRWSSTQRDLISVFYRSSMVRLTPFSISLKGTYNTPNGSPDDEKIRGLTAHSPTMQRTIDWLHLRQN